SLTMILASFSRDIGPVLPKKWKSPELVPFSAIAWQMIVPGIANLLFAVALRAHSLAVWIARGIGAIVYLIVCGSWIGYTAYIWLLGHVPTSKVSTYAYVNPVVAVFLGWLILHEPITPYILAGSAIVVASVALVTSAEVKTRTSTEQMQTIESA